jgi:DNA-binding transcriptional LysR family regulator
MQVMAANLQNLDWNSLRLLLAFGEGNSLARAARLLSLDATTVARRLRKLERELGITVMISEGKRLRLSQAGAQAIAAAREMENVALRLLRELAAHEAQVQGMVRITALRAILMYLVVPSLAALRARHPGLTLHLLADARNLSIGRQEADLAIRLARPTHPDVTARKLFDVPYVIAGASDAGWIALEEPLASVPEMRWVNQHVQPDQILMRSNCTELIAAAVRSGNARALLPQFLCDGLPCGVPVLVREAWLVMHKETHQTPRIRAVADWLVGLAAGAARSLRQPATL